jgi:hypothetical protein
MNERRPIQSPNGHHHHDDVDVSDDHHESGQENSDKANKSNGQTVASFKNRFESGERCVRCQMMREVEK